MPALLRIFIAGTCSAALVAGCSSATPLGTPAQVAATTAPSPSTTPVAPASTAPGATSAASPVPLASMHAGVAGKADLAGAAFVNADVKIFQLGKAEPIATSKTSSDGSFWIDLGTKVQGGTPIKMVVTQNGQTLASVGAAGIVAQGGGNIVAQGGGNIVAQGGGNIVAQGGGNIVAQGGGNIVAQGGGNIVAQGGGNIVAQGGGNIVAQGGGNIVAQGGGNYVILDAAATGTSKAPTQLVYKVTLSTTLAVALLEPRFEAVGTATVLAGGQPLDSLIGQFILTYAQLELVTDTLVTADAALATPIIGTLDTNGNLKPSQTFFSELANHPDLVKQFLTTGQVLATIVLQGVAGGGTPPTSIDLGSIQLGVSSTGAITVTSSSQTNTGNTSGGGGGSNGADNTVIPSSTGGSVNLSGTLEQPTPTNDCSDGC